jgi:hypothetical protein
VAPAPRFHVLCEARERQPQGQERTQKEPTRRSPPSQRCEERNTCTEDSAAPCSVQFWCLHGSFFVALWRYDEVPGGGPCRILGARSVRMPGKGPKWGIGGSRLAPEGWRETAASSGAERRPRVQPPLASLHRIAISPALNLKRR